MKNYRVTFSLSTFFIMIYIFSACAGSGQKEKADKDTDPWSVRMADAVMTRTDSLVHYLGNTTKRWSYDISFLGEAIDKLGSFDPKYSKYMEDWVKSFIRKDGSVIDYNIEEYNLDRIRPANDLLTQYKREENAVYKVALDRFITQLESHPKTKSGGYWHKKIYPWQMWLDGIFMASPFMTRYAREFNAPEWYDVAAKQVTLIYDKTLDENTGLLVHAWDESREQKWCDPETGKSHYPWGRAMGWYTMALVGVLDNIPADHPDRDQMTLILQKLCDALLKVSDPETGLYYQVLDQGSREGNYLEASCSAMFTYVFAAGAKRGYLDEKYLDIAGKTFDRYVKQFVITDDDGLPTITSVCEVGGLGGNPYRDGSFEYYINERKRNNDPKAVAPFILAAIELGK